MIQFDELTSLLFEYRTCVDEAGSCKMVKLNEGLEPEYIVLIREIFSRVPSS